MGVHFKTGAAFYFWTPPVPCVVCECPLASLFVFGKPAPPLSVGPLAWASLLAKLRSASGPRGIRWTRHALAYFFLSCFTSTSYNSANSPTNDGWGELVCGTSTGLPYTTAMVTRPLTSVWIVRHGTSTAPVVMASDTSDVGTSSSPISPKLHATLVPLRSSLRAASSDAIGPTRGGASVGRLVWVAFLVKPVHLPRKAMRLCAALRTDEGNDSGRRVTTGKPQTASCIEPAST
mmetsp:Transcript_43452/g.117903  ORF Transcript_43452/g.117903 Transcript_43452/m.117903 type:complete len:234 (-) Transcript_43452:2627-3328(-)